MDKKLNEQKKGYLASYKMLYQKKQSLEEQLQSLREIGQSAKNQKLSDMPRGSEKKDLSDYIVKIDLLISRIENLKADCMQRRLDIENYIAELENGVESSLLFKRYIEFKTWEQICEEINYSWMQTYRIHGNALKNLMIFDDIE